MRRNGNSLLLFEKVGRTDRECSRQARAFSLRGELAKLQRMSEMLETPYFGRNMSREFLETGQHLCQSPPWNWTLYSSYVASPTFLSSLELRVTFLKKKRREDVQARTGLHVQVDQGPAAMKVFFWDTRRDVNALYDHRLVKTPGSVIFSEC
jgi:hypothetical protein